MTSFPAGIGDNGLREARLRRGWSQQRMVIELRNVATQVGVELPAASTLVSMVSRWEHSRVQPNALYRRLLTVLYGATEEELGLERVEPSQGGLGPHPGAQHAAPVVWAPMLDHLGLLARPPSIFLDVLHGGVGDALSVQDETLRAVGDRVDQGVCSVVLQLVDAARRLDRTFGAGSTAYLLAGLWNWMASTVQHAPAGRARRDLTRLQADVGSLLGWQALSLGRTDLALRYYSAATAAAREADDPSLHAFVFGESSYVELQAGQPSRALRVIDAARQLVPSQRHPPELRAWLDAAHAEHLAAAGQADAALRALERAGRHLRSASPSGELEGLAYLDGSHMNRWAATALARCGRPEGVPALRIAVAEVDPSFVRARAVLMIELAEALERLGDRSEAVTAAEKGSVLAAQTSAHYQLTRGLRVVDRLRERSPGTPGRRRARA